MCASLALPFHTYRLQHLALIAGAYTPLAWADTIQSASILGDITQMLLGLAVVLAVIFALMYLLKRFGVHPAGSGLKIVGNTSVGPRERVVLVEIGEEVLVLGVAPGRITHLHTVPSSRITPPSSPQETSFKERLQQFMERKA